LEPIIVEVPEPIYRPEPPPEFADAWKKAAPQITGVYQVMQGDAIVALYHGAYFRSTKEVLSDLLALLERGLEGPYTGDYVIWQSSRVMAVIHESMAEEHREVQTFTERGNDNVRWGDPWPQWPTYEQWAASGRGPLWKTEMPDYPMADDDDPAAPWEID
jgi:hypothetical protein